VKSTAAQESVVTLGLLRFHGSDATAFLQGQLSNDIEALAVGATQLAGYHNPQGRVIALLRLTRAAPGEILAQLPLELVEPVAQRLRRYVLRSKLAIDVPDAAAAAAGATGTATTRSRLADIAAGLPQVYAATSEQFVAQMLNLDCIDAVSFTKGCYTGQEVVARAHYRGRVKRRMQRFVTTAAAADASVTGLRCRRCHRVCPRRAVGEDRRPTRRARPRCAPSGPDRPGRRIRRRSASLRRNGAG